MGRRRIDIAKSKEYFSRRHVETSVPADLGESEIVARGEGEDWISGLEVSTMDGVKRHVQKE